MKALPLLLAAGLATALAAEPPPPPRAVVSLTGKPVQQETELIERVASRLGRRISPLPPGTRPPPGALILTLGRRSAETALRWGNQTVAAFAPGLELPTGFPPGFLSIQLVPGPEETSALLRKEAPRIRKMAVFWQDGSFDDYVRSLARACAGSGLSIRPVRMSPDSEWGEVLRGLQGAVDSLWVLPDPALVTRDRMEVLRAFAVANDIVLVGSTREMARVGAEFSLTPSEEEHEAAILDALRESLSGAQLTAVRFPSVAVPLRAPGRRPGKDRRR